MGKKVPIAERALFARIDRLLAKDGKSIRRCREDSRSFATCGRYFILDINKNVIVNADVGLEAFGRELGVLKDFEELSE